MVYTATTWQLYFVAIIGGLVWAGSTATSSAIIGDLYGVELVGLLYGWAYFGHQIGGAVGSFLGGWGYETFGTHVVAFGVASILLIIGGFVSFQLPSRLPMLTFSVNQKLQARGQSFV